MRRAHAALAAGLATLALVIAASSLAWADDSPLVPRDGGTGPTGPAVGFLALLLGAFVAYAAAVALLRRVELAAAATIAVAVAIQCAPLAAPLVLSTDAWTYWGYGWIAAEGGGNPYAEPPSAFPGSPALNDLGAAWRETTSVYGPAFTLVSEPVAAVSGSSRDAAAWIFKALAAAGMVTAAILAGRLSRRRALAVAFVGWNPVLAVHMAGGGHNDALVGALLAAALALATAGRANAAGAAWALAILVKWVPLLFLALRLVEARANGRAIRAAGFASTAAVVVALATWRYGTHWLGAVSPLAGNAARATSYAIPSRLEAVGVPHALALSVAAAVLVAGAACLVLQAHRGKARLARAACLLLLTTPYLAVWYLGWAVPLAAADDDDGLARACCLALTAYLLPQTIPL